MKEKILTFIIGFLVGAIIITLGFYIYIKFNNNQNANIPNEEMPKVMNQKSEGTPPEKPTGELKDNQSTPPEMPLNDNNI